MTSLSGFQAAWVTEDPAQSTCWVIDPCPEHGNEVNWKNFSLGNAAQSLTGSLPLGKKGRSRVVLEPLAPREMLHSALQMCGPRTALIFQGFFNGKSSKTGIFMLSERTS